MAVVLDSRFGAVIVLDGQSHYPPRRDVDHHGEMHLALGGGMFGDLVDPEPGRSGAEWEFPRYEQAGSVGNSCSQGGRPTVG